MLQPEMRSWRELISEEMEDNGESWDMLVHITLTPKQADKRFHAGFGGKNGRPFTAWTENFVYFPVCYDGAEWCGSVPRNPSDKPTEHVGGG